MRNHSVIAPSFWTGTTGRALRGDAPAQVVATYLLTSPHATMIGVFTCPPIYIAHETGLSVGEVERSLTLLETLSFCRVDRDRDLIWVREMARFQVGQELSAGDKRVKNVALLFAKIPSGEIKDAFFERYQADFHLPSHDPSKGHGKGHFPTQDAPSKGSPEPEKPLRSQEQEQEQDYAVLTDGGASPPPASPAFRSVLGGSPGASPSSPLRLVADPVPAEAKAAGPPAPSDPADPERELFARGKTVLGSSAGGQIRKLLRAKGDNVALARAAIETASTKHNAREYVARIIRGDDTGMPPGQLYDRGL